MQFAGVLALVSAMALWRWQAHRVITANAGVPVPYLRRPARVPHHSYWVGVAAVFSTTFALRLLLDPLHGTSQDSVGAAIMLVILFVVIDPIARHNRRLGR